MENLNKEYMERFYNYIVAMVYYENLLNREETTVGRDIYFYAHVSAA